MAGVDEGAADGVAERVDGWSADGRAAGPAPWRGRLRCVRLLIGNMRGSLEAAGKGEAGRCGLGATARAWVRCAAFGRRGFGSAQFGTWGRTPTIGGEGREGRDGRGRGLRGCEAGAGRRRAWSAVCGGWAAPGGCAAEELFNGQQALGVDQLEQA